MASTASQASEVATMVLVSGRGLPCIIELLDASVTSGQCDGVVLCPGQFLFFSKRKHGSRRW